ncbi:MAG: hypothetical protein QN178_15665 [Armatimonadota bacterium]|nr:hypothetical protein [Armatimonadota bacterium]
MVVVADFDGPQAGKFGLLVQVFLASWMDHRGASRDWPVHVVSIGEPPAAVVSMARRAGAAIVRVPPLILNPKRTSNKIRGLEIAAQTGRIVMLDADTLVLHDLAPLVAFTRDAIGVSSLTANHFPESTWRRMYEVVGVPYPGPTGACWARDPRIAAARGLTEPQRRLTHVSPPYFHSGVIVTPEPGRLAARWQAHLAAVLPLFLGRAPLEDWGRAGLGDEHALATALESLRHEGARVVEIPRTFHARPVLLHAGTHTWQDFAILHYHSLLKPYASSVAELGDLLYGRVWRAVRERLARRVGLRAIRSPVYRRVLARDAAAAEVFYRYLHHLYQAYLRDAGA